MPRTLDSVIEHFSNNLKSGGCPCEDEYREIYEWLLELKQRRENEAVCRSTCPDIPAAFKGRLQQMWNQQEAFMKLLQKKRGFPQYPVDLTSKVGQKELKKITYDCMGELFEANQHLKNSKDHRATEVKDVDRDKYVEELVDALHYFLELVIMSGISLDELYKAYIEKGHINDARIASGY